MTEEVMLFLKPAKKFVFTLALNEDQIKQIKKWFKRPRRRRKRRRR